MDSGADKTSGRNPYDDEPARRRRAHRRWPWAAAGVALAVAAVAAGAAVAGTMNQAAPAPAAGSAISSTAAVVAPTASAPTTTTTPTPTVTTSAPVPTPAAPPSTPSTAAAGSWATYTSPDGQVSFEHPATWPVSSPPGAAGSGTVDVDVSDETGMVVASLHAGPSGGIGGACQGAVPYAVLDSVEVDVPYQPTKGSVTPRFTFRALQESDHVTASYGLTSFAAGQNGSTCMFYNAVNGPAGSPLFSFADTFQVNAGGTEQIPNRKGAKQFPTMGAARAYMQTPEYLNAKRMITSVKVTAG